MDYDDIEIPQYFLCPISLQIMKDPVTAATGITYDRKNIEKWLTTTKYMTCPVTKQRLSGVSDLTPNHVLHRLIQRWCIDNEKNRGDESWTPKSPLKCANDIVTCFKEGNTFGLEENLKFLEKLWDPNEEMKIFVNGNSGFIDSLIRVLGLEMDDQIPIRNHAMKVLKLAIEIANAKMVQSLDIEFFKTLVESVKAKVGIKSALQILIEVCTWGRNRMKICEAEAIFVLLELELEKPEKNITELIFILLAHLCACADGRAKFLQHVGAIAVVSKRILRVSAVTNDRGVHILLLIAKFCGRDEVLMEMMKVGGVGKLCMVMQSDCASSVKDKAKKVLRLHCDVWNKSPCLDVYLLTNNPR